MNAYAAIDLGATSGRVLLGRLADGRIETHELARFANDPVRVPGGVRPTLTWDVLSLWSGALAGLTAARESGLRSVGVDTWAVDYGLLDADQELLAHPVHYRDERTAGATERLFATLSPAEHYAITGLQVQPFNTVFQLLAARPVQLGSARRVLLMPDLFSWWLSGRQVAEVTNASTTGLLDVRTRTWSGRVLSAVERLAGVDVAGLLPSLVEPGTALGPLRPELGLGDAEVIAVGSHDTASAVAAVPMQDPDHAAYISSGTWSLVGVELAEPVLSEESRAANFTNELGIDGTVRYLKNVAGLWLLSESQRTWRATGRAHDLPTLLAGAAEVPACRTVVDVDAPAFATPGDMPGRIREAARRTGQAVPEDEMAVTRCILDSLALAYRRAVRDAARLSGRDLRVLHIVGGGSRNALLCQLTADATGLPVLAGPAEGTAIGNLLVQALAIGDLDGGLPAIRDVVAASTDVVRWTPTVHTRAWDQAENRLRDTPAARP